MAPPRAAREHRSEQQRLATAALLVARSTWGQIRLGDLEGSWALLSRRLLFTLTESQRRAVTAASAYVPAVLAEQSIDIEPEWAVNAEPLIGIASDGRPLDSLLYQPIIRTKTLIRDGVDAPAAASGGLQLLERIVTTQVADAARVTVGLETIARPRIGYVRMLSTPSCSRCVVLAGKWFRSNTGFPRHPLCDCVHIPTTENRAGDLRTDPRKAVEAGQVTGLSKADARAILEDGADVGQVINARRGMKPGGITTEGTTRRAFAGRRMREAGDTFQGTRTSRYSRTTTARLRPEAIYRQASSRAEALELLRRYGYVV